MRQEPATLAELVEMMRPREEVNRVTLQELLDHVGPRSYAPIILVPALFLVSPLSAIPGSPTIGTLIIVTVVVQALFGRRHIWLPGLLMNRSLPAHHLRRALDWLERPVSWVDGHTRDRFKMLTSAPLNRIPMLAILCTALPWPMLEPLPMVTSIGAFAVSLFCIGLMLRDGLWVMAGFAFLGGLATALISIWQGLI